MPRDGQWVPLESNENVMNIYLSKLGVVPGLLQFAEVLSLEDWAQEMIHAPCPAVICCFPITAASEAHALQESEAIARDGQAQSDKIFYMKQTIGNACGTIAILHALGNTRDHIDVAPGSYLAGFFSAVQGMSPEEIGAYLETDDKLEAVHEEAAGGGQSEVPADLDNVNLHFICFAAVEGCLYELDGRKRGPVNHGPTDATNVLPDACRVIQAFMDRDPANLNFTIVALSLSPSLAELADD